jgi:hypothetical protein
MSLSQFQSDKCIKIVDKLIGWKVCKPFVEMLDPVRDGAPNYLEFVKVPMSPNEVKSRITTKRYNDISEFTRDMNLIWDNARLYNGDESYYTYCALEAKDWFNKKMEHFPGMLVEEWMRKMQKVMSAFHQAIRHPSADLLPSAPAGRAPDKPASKNSVLLEAGMFEEEKNIRH